jgi:SNF2 family DNA or RNA helicase
VETAALPTHVVELTNEWSKNGAARAVPGSYWHRERGAWVVENPTPRTAAVILRVFPDLGGKHPELNDLREQLLQDVRPFDNATPAGLRIRPPEYARFDDPMLRPGTAAQVGQQLHLEDKWWYDFQDLDLGYVAGVLREHGGAYIGWERGLGKTLGACSLIDALGSQRTLVVCPNTAKESVWAAEIRRFLPSHAVMVLPNQKAKREAMLRGGLGEWKEPLVLVVHYEALAIIAGKKKQGRSTVLGDGWKKLGEWDLVIADEAHRIWNTKAQMTRAIKKVPSRMRLALSGSIIQNHAEEMFSPLQWLFPQTYRAKWRDWNDRFIEYVEDGYGRTAIGILPHQLDTMRDELGVFMVYRRKTDELDLPERTEQTLMVELSPAQRKAYDDVRDRFITVLDDGTVVKTADRLAQLTRLRQIATGLDIFAETVTDSTKVDTALEIIEDNPDEAFVVFSWYKACARTLQERLERRGIECFRVDGDVKQHDRADMIGRFMAGEGRVFLGTLSTLSESVNLQRASNVIFLDRSWNPATNTQAADRVYRIGQTNAVTITHLVAKDTVDELRVLPTLANKEALRRSIFGGE